MTALRLYLILAWTALITFTAFVIGRDGLNLLPVFFGDIAAGHWPGQFNADFLSMLALSALWTGWRSGWSAAGWALAVMAFFLTLPYGKFAHGIYRSAALLKWTIEKRQASRLKLGGD